MLRLLAPCCAGESCQTHAQSITSAIDWGAMLSHARDTPGRLRPIASDSGCAVLPLFLLSRRRGNEACHPLPGRDVHAVYSASCERAAGGAGLGCVVQR